MCRLDIGNYIMFEETGERERQLLLKGYEKSKIRFSGTVWENGQEAKLSLG